MARCVPWVCGPVREGRLTGGRFFSRSRGGSGRRFAGDPDPDPVGLGLLGGAGICGDDGRIAGMRVVESTRVAGISSPSSAREYRPGDPIFFFSGAASSFDFDDSGGFSSGEERDVVLIPPDLSSRACRLRGGLSPAPKEEEDAPSESITASSPLSSFGCLIFINNSGRPVGAADDQAVRRSLLATRRATFAFAVHSTSHFVRRRDRASRPRSAYLFAGRSHHR